MVFSGTDIFIMALAGFLAIFGVLLIIFRHATHGSVFFALSCLTFSAVLVSGLLLFSEVVYQSFCLIIWPSFLIFSKLQSDNIGYRIKYLWHYITPILWILVDSIIPTEMRNGIFDALYLIQILVYVGLSLSEFNKAKKSNSSSLFKKQYLNVLLIGLVILLLTRFTLPIFTTNVMGAFHLVVAFYLIAVSGFFVDSPVRASYQTDDIDQSHELANYEEQMKRKLKRIMNDEKAYLNPELTLNDLALLADLKLPELSGFINTNLGKNFNDYVNDYRVEEFKKLVRAKSTDPKATVMELAYTSGFNSKASFNRIFKEHTGK
ncbi:helix-turn-helix domain-containing protein, partial [Fulvivirga lutimaris]|uniref:helix-turn-helix domain-containing protein n=1 Tax=Fulvivirga lutimaris TaxID=1819566 RepID=UPI0012BBF2E5